MASITSVAERMRPALMSATLLAAIAVIPWHERGNARLDTPVAIWVPAPIERGPELFAIVPPAHPDARPWPYGMVITPGDVRDDAIIQLPPLPPGTMIDLAQPGAGALVSVLSALLAPWLTGDATAGA